MLSHQLLSKFYDLLLDSSARKSDEFPEFTQRASKHCPIKFTLNLIKVLQVAQEVVLAALLLAKKAVDTNLRISKRFLYRLIVVSIILAEKCLEEQENTMESYSLITGVPIKDLALIESKTIALLDYRLLPKQKEYQLLKKGDIQALFLCFLESSRLSVSDLITSKTIFYELERMYKRIIEIIIEILKKYDATSTKKIYQEFQIQIQ